MFSMGEWSKTVGEFGEKTVENFLKLIGWTNLPKGIDITCLHPDLHSEDGSSKTHGLDFFHSYRSPLIDGVLKNVYISVKYTSNKYPAGLSTTFRRYFEDLVFLIECFVVSDKKRELGLRTGGIETIEEVGVLFWLSNAENSDDDIITRLAGTQTTSSKKVHSIMLVDNKRVEFITRAIRYSSSLLPTAEVNFYYPGTGKNIIPTTRVKYGKVLPVEYMNASILPVRVEDATNNNVHLVLFTIDSFEQGDLKRLIGLAQEISGSWTSSVIIAFPDYDELTHANDVKAAQNSFENKTMINNLRVVRYVENFKSI